MTVHEVDFVGKDDMLEILDKFRQAIIDGQIISFAAVGVEPGGTIYHCHSAFNAQKPVLIGAMMMKANVMSAQCTVDAMIEVLGI